MKNLIGSEHFMASPIGDPVSELKSRRERARSGGGRKALEAIRATGRVLHETVSTCCWIRIHLLKWTPL